MPEKSIYKNNLQKCLWQRTKSPHKTQNEKSSRRTFPRSIGESGTRVEAVREEGTVTEVPQEGGKRQARFVQRSAFN